MSNLKITTPIPFYDDWGCVGYGWECPSCKETNFFQTVHEGGIYYCEECEDEFESSVDTPTDW